MEKGVIFCEKQPQGYWDPLTGYIVEKVYHTIRGDVDKFPPLKNYVQEKEREIEVLKGRIKDRKKDMYELLGMYFSLYQYFKETLSTNEEILDKYPEYFGFRKWAEHVKKSLKTKLPCDIYSEQERVRELCGEYQRF